MYETFFGLTRNPFTMTPDPSALFLTVAHREALAGLSYAIMERKGFVLLVGEAGTGKTTLLRRLLELAREANAQTCVISNPTLTPAEFLELLLYNFGIKDFPVSKARRLILLEEMLVAAHEEGRAPVLVIDEAHKLSFEVLEEIRLLTNFETKDQKLLQIVLAGQPELNEIFNRPELWQLKQRVAIRLRVDALTRKQVDDYLVYRWVKIGGAQLLPFTDDAIALIVKWSRGVPRLVNSICDNALLLAFSNNTRVIGQWIIQEVVRDLDLKPGPGFEHALRVTEMTEPKPMPMPVPVIVPELKARPVSFATLDRYTRPEPKPFFLQRWTARLRA